MANRHPSSLRTARASRHAKQAAVSLAATLLTLAAAWAEVKLTGIEVTSTPATNVTVHGKGEAGTAYQLK